MMRNNPWSPEQTNVKKHKQETKRFSTSASLLNKKHCFAKCCFGNQTVFDSRNMFPLEHVRNVSGWRRRMWKTMWFCVLHLFSGFLGPFAVGFRQASHCTISSLPPPPPTTPTLKRHHVVWDPLQFRRHPQLKNCLSIWLTILICIPWHVT